jgi:hypothetical protein
MCSAWKLPSRLENRLWIALNNFEFWMFQNAKRTRNTTLNVALLPARTPVLNLKNNLFARPLAHLDASAALVMWETKILENVYQSMNAQVWS